MLIGELAARTGLSRDAIGFYGESGVDTGGRPLGGYRDVPPETVLWLLYVRTAQTLGFSLAETGRHGAELCDAPAPADALCALMEEKIRLIDSRMAELASLRAGLGARVGTGCPLRAARGRQPLTATWYAEAHSVTAEASPTTARTLSSDSPAATSAKPRTATALISAAVPLYCHWS